MKRRPAPGPLGLALFLDHFKVELPESSTINQPLREMESHQSSRIFARFCATLVFFNSFAMDPAWAAPRPTVIDNSFKPDLLGWNIGSIRSVVQSDGKLVVAGLSNSVPVITKLNEDGSMDGSFKLDSLFLQWWPNGEQGGIEALAVQPDGKILVAEWAVWFGVNREYNYKNRLVRLNQDSSLDLTFKPPSELPVHIDYLQALPDGRVFMANNPGGCGEADGKMYLHNNGVLLTATGSVDPQLSRVRFMNKTTCGSFIGSVALSSEGKLLVAGQFVRPGINVIRLNVDGTLDTSFKAQLPEGWDQVSAVTAQSDGKVVAALARSNRPDSSSADEALLIRLLPDGRLDPSFTPAQEASHYPIINALTARDGDKILIAPDLFFHGYSLRLKRDGALDLDLTAVAIPIGTVSSAALDHADRVIGLLTFSPSPNIGPSSWGFGPHKFGRFLTQGTTIPGIAFAQARYTVNENEPAAMITLRRSADISKPLSIRLTTQDATAKAGADYVARNELVQMAAGEETRAFQIPIRDDPAVEGNETVLLALSDPGLGAVIGGHDSAVLTIVDNERPTLLDPSFRAEFEGWGPFVVQPNGKLVVAGRFLSSPSGTTCLARLNTDGSADRTFESSCYQIDSIGALAIQADGRLLAGLYTYNNQLGTLLIRLKPDGTTDTNFDPNFANPEPAPSNRGISSIAIQSDGRILAGGRFSLVNGTSHNSIVRLNPDGAVDSTFQAQIQESMDRPASVNRVLLQDNGQILVNLGAPALVNGKLHSGPVRLNADGTIDESFGPAIPLGAQIVLARDSKIFTLNSDGIRRFNRDGSQDDSFQFVAGQDWSINALIPTVEGGALIRDWDAERVLRLDANGRRLDEYPLASFNILGEANGALLVGGWRLPLARLLPLGNSYLGVQFAAPGAETVLHMGEDSGSATVMLQRTGDTSSALKVDYVTTGDPAYAGRLGTVYFAPLETTRSLSLPISDDQLVNSNRIFNVVLTNASSGVLLGSRTRAQNVVVHDNERPGSLDFTFAPLLRDESYGNIEAIALQADGKILTAGVFASHDGERYTTLERLNQDGSRDDTFEVTIEPNFGWGASASISFIVPRSDGKIVVGGKHPVARLQADGSIDDSFDARDMVGKVNALAVQPDEKVLVAGAPLSQGQPAKPVLVRLHPDGRFDSSFAVTTNITQVTALAVQPDGRILAVANAGGRSQFLRFENSGAIDPTFRPASVATNRVPAFALESDGKVLLQALSGDSTTRFVRLNPDGSVDSSFVDSSAGGKAAAIAVQSDGRILLAGDDVWRLNADGSVDTSFHTGSGPQGSVNGLILQPNGRVIVSGTFAEFDGVPRRGIARLHGDPELRFTGTAKGINGALELTWTTLPGRRYILQVSPNLRDWTAIRTNIAITYMTKVEHLPPGGSSEFYRVLRGKP